MQRSLTAVSNRDGATHELDVGALGAALKRRRGAIVIPTLLAFLAIGVFVNIVTPRYTAESQVLLENQETFFTRPDRSATATEQASLVDPEAVGSQIQLVTSRDLVKRAINDLHLQGDPEFDPAARMGAVTRVMVLLGVARDPTRDTAEARIVQAFAEKLTVFSPPKTRVITIQFQSKDPDLAARAANKMAELYIAEQSAAKRISARDAADALGGQIADLRIKLAKADAEREQYRNQSGLLAGSNNMTISGQQLADINSDLSKARATQADAQAKASLLRDLIHEGKTTDVPDVINNDLVRRVAEQRVTAQAQLAQESRTLLPGHPRIKELIAQVAALDGALKAAAKQAVTTLENEAKISGQRVANLETVLNEQKKVAGTANGDEVRLRSLDRIAQSYKDQLDSSMTKYQEALARQTSPATPADARIITRATQPQEASFPKKIPFMIFGTIATFVFAVGFVVASELLSDPVPARDDDVVLTPAVLRGVDETPDAPLQVAPASAVVEVVQPAPEPIVKVAAPPAPPMAVEPRVAATDRSRVLKADPVHQRRPGKTIPAWDFRALVDRLKHFGRSAADSRVVQTGAAFAPAPITEGVGWNEGVAVRGATSEAVAPSTLRGAATTQDAGDADVHALADHIVAAHVPGRGLHVVGAALGSGVSTRDDLIDLSRVLADRGRAIIVDLNAAPSALAALAGPGREGARTVMTLAGLSELLSDNASFAEVIHRDHRSRLHFIPTGLREADYRDFDLILDALSETYDFIVLLAPAFPQSDIAKVMAPYADFVVLAPAKDSDDTTFSVLESELIEAGAQEVLVIGRAMTTLDRARTPHVA